MSLIARGLAHIREVYGARRPDMDADGWYLHGGEIAAQLDAVPVSAANAAQDWFGPQPQTVYECPRWWAEEAHEQHVWTDETRGRVLCPGLRGMVD